MSSLKTKALSFDEVWETLPQGWLSWGEAKTLWLAALGSDPTGAILEVGCYRGRSTVLLASLAPRWVYAVDPFSNFDSDDPSGDKIYQMFADALSKRNTSNVMLFRQRIEDWKSLPCTFAYLDGDHSYQGTLNQIEAVRKTGALSFAVHDVADSGGGAEIKRAIIDSPDVSIVKQIERLAVCQRVMTHAP